MNRSVGDGSRNWDHHLCHVPRGEVLALLALQSVADEDLERVADRVPLGVGDLVLLKPCYDVADRLIVEPNVRLVVLKDLRIGVANFAVEFADPVPEVSIGVFIEPAELDDVVGAAVLVVDLADEQPDDLADDLLIAA